MRIHIQTGRNMVREITPEIWRAGVGAAGLAEGDFRVSFGHTPEDFHEAIGSAEVVIAGGGTVGRLRPFAAASLKIYFSTSAGVDGLLPFDWLPAGAVVLNNSGVHATKTGEYAAMALLMLNARLPEFIAGQHAGRWERHMTPSIRGRRVTVLGTGALGGAAAAQARHFGAVVTGVSRSGAAHAHCDRMRPTEALDEVLPETDLLVIALPLTPATRLIMNAARLALLPRGAGLVNVGRGELIDQEALCDLLDAGALGGAILDVFTPEPLPPGHRVWTTRNLVVTPHVSAADPVTYYPDTLDVFFRNLAAWRAGEKLPNLVDLTHGY